MTRACCEVGENWKAEEFGLKRYGWLGLVEFFGILRFAQDDSRNGQRRGQATARDRRWRDRQRQQEIHDGMTKEQATAKQKK
jgi:hypothetical protein